MTLQSKWKSNWGHLTLFCLFQTISIRGTPPPPLPHHSVILLSSLPFPTLSWYWQILAQSRIGSLGWIKEETSIHRPIWVTGSVPEHPSPQIWHISHPYILFLTSRFFQAWPFLSVLSFFPPACSDFNWIELNSSDKITQKQKLTQAHTMRKMASAQVCMCICAHTHELSCGTWHGAEREYWFYSILHH